MINLDRLATAIEKAGDAKYGVKDHYFIGQFPMAHITVFCLIRLKPGAAPHN